MFVAKFDDDFIQYSKKKVKDETTNLALYLFSHITLYILLIFFAIFFIWYTVFISTHSYYVVYGASMKNTLNSSLSLTDASTPQDAVYVATTSRIRAYDIVVATKQNSANVIKRAMAFEGDYITIATYTDQATGEENFYFYRIVSGTDLENFTDEDARLDEASGALGYTICDYANWKDVQWEYSLGSITYEGQFYTTYLQSYEAGSDDWFVSSAGLVYVKVPKGKVFLLGDNRAYSVDSRDSANGFFDLSQIVGRVEIIVYNHSFVNRIWEVVKYYFSEVEDFFAR
jgi:signal peptidase I